MTTQKQPDGLIHKQAEDLSRDAKSRRSRPVVLGKVNLLLALLALVVLAGAYWMGVLAPFLPGTLALLVLTLSLVTVASRVWHARRGGLEYGLLRHPFRRELRPYLLQCLNHWLFWASFGAAILAGAFAGVPAIVAPLLGLPLPDVSPYRPLVISLGVGALVMAALAVVPRARVQVATNVLVAIGTVFLRSWSASWPDRSISLASTGSRRYKPRSPGSIRLGSLSRPPRNLRITQLLQAKERGTQR